MQRHKHSCAFPTGEEIEEDEEALDEFGGFGARETSEKQNHDAFGVRRRQLAQADGQDQRLQQVKALQSGKDSYHYHY